MAHGTAWKPLRRIYCVNRSKGALAITMEVWWRKLRQRIKGFSKAGFLTEGVYQTASALHDGSLPFATNDKASCAAAWMATAQLAVMVWVRLHRHWMKAITGKINGLFIGQSGVLTNGF